MGSRWQAAWLCALLPPAPCHLYTDPMNRVVVITGASAGIGAAIANELGRRGDSLVLASRTTDALERVAAQISSRTRVVTADVTRRSDVERIRDEAIAAFGHVDVWINNAGKGILRPVMELTDDDVDTISGMKDQLVGKLQEKYGYARDRAEREIDDFCRTC